ncbi:beta/alpha barrel domain-containing protein [Clostridium estertheticum]|uniref:homocitrate synthase n=1 Tax=Clostridium estertheticum TaxID=238834 RepID=UPI000AA00493|nr:homocitrate synthase [Clostridium estertheticum]MBU3173415.1 homocitrate synthase [Clostridium estertheticum]MBZ9614256.1 homocitrate synthase [Clostridium estertheticum subsp. laramiense]WAG74196.1 homocitrate synthase [Clostridium estertheticum]
MYKIVDTTLRDGEQMAGVELGFDDKIEFAKIIDSKDVYQIEAGTPAMGGDEKKSIEQLMSLGLKSKVSAWNRMNISDIKHSIDCRVDIVHISVPVSDIQIKWKLGRNRVWVINEMKRSVYYAKEKGYEVVVGLEDASRTSIEFLIHIIREAKELGVQRVRYADTVGILYPDKIYKQIKQIKKNIDISIEFHAHNDFGMAVANSVSAVMAGAEFVDSTFGGIGERAGNCDYVKLINALDKNNNLV